MIFKEQFKVPLKDIGKENYITNKGILEILENVGTHHSDLVGYGPNDIRDKGASWILLDWKIQVLKRPKYGQILNVSTWGRAKRKTYTYRDFEIYDSEGNLCVIGTSKWVLVDINTGRITRITDDVYEKYQIEEKSVFNIEELDKLEKPEEYSSEVEYKICRRDIDLNEHVHNLYYLDLAYEALPEEVYKNTIFDSVRIQYKKEIKYGDIVKCRYTFKDGEHIITICSEDESKVHSIIILK